MANTSSTERVHMPEQDTLLTHLRNFWKVPDALTHLKGYRNLPRTATEAVQQLRYLESGRTLYRLYRTYFPDEWERSSASLRIGDIGYSDRELEFLHLVNQHLFPFDLDYMVDQAADDGRIEYIETSPYSTLWWQDIEDMTPGWQFLLAVSGGYQANSAWVFLQDIEGLEPSLRAEIDEVIQAPGPGYTLLRLQQLCAHVDPPLTHLSLALSLVLYDTGNPWLDISGDDGTMPFEGARWREHDIELLRDTFRDAQDIEQRAQELVDWLEVQTTDHMRRVLDLLRQASL